MTSVVVFVDDGGDFSTHCGAIHVDLASGADNVEIDVDVLLCPDDRHPNLEIHLPIVFIHRSHLPPWSYTSLKFESLTNIVKFFRRGKTNSNPDFWQSCSLASSREDGGNCPQPALGRVLRLMQIRWVFQKMGSGCWSKERMYVGAESHNAASVND